MTDDSLILAHMRERGPITPKMAYKLFGCLALHSAIARLRVQGHNIKTTMRRENGDSFGEYSIESPGAALDQGPSRRMGHQKATTQARSATLPVASPADALPAVVAPNESMVYDDKGKPLYIAVGVGPGWPPDQDHLHWRTR